MSLRQGIATSNRDRLTSYRQDITGGTASTMSELKQIEPSPSIHQVFNNSFVFVNGDNVNTSNNFDSFKNKMNESYLSYKLKHYLNKPNVNTYRNQN